MTTELWKAIRSGAPFLIAALIIGTRLVSTAHAQAATQPSASDASGVEGVINLEPLLAGPEKARAIAVRAKKLLDRGDRAGARQVLSEAVALLVGSAKQAHGAQKFREAAAAYGQAAAIADAFDPQRVWLYRLSEGKEFFAQADSQVDDAAIDGSVAAFREAAKLVTFEVRPSEWFLSQTKLGEALHRRGQYYDDAGAFREALTVFEAILAKRDVAINRGDWAQAKRDVCNTLRDLAGEVNGDALNEDVFECYNQVFPVYEQDADWPSFAWTKLAIGHAYSELGPKSSKALRLQKAAAAFRSGLQVISGTSDSELYGNLKRAYGKTLESIVKQGGDPAQLRDAVAELRDALTVYSRQSSPRDWARTQSDLGDALRRLAGRSHDDNAFREAAECYQAALLEWTRERDPQGFAMTQTDLGDIFYGLGTRADGTSELTQAVTAYREALSVRSPTADGKLFTVTRKKLDAALFLLQTRDAGMEVRR